MVNWMGSREELTKSLKEAVARVKALSPEEMAERSRKASQELLKLKKYINFKRSIILDERIDHIEEITTQLQERVKDIETEVREIKTLIKQLLQKLG